MSRKEELEVVLGKMQEASDTFYRSAVQINCHPFIEFTGLMNEYIDACKNAMPEGIDFTEASQHTGLAIPLKSFQASYLGEKMGCIFGPSFKNPKTLKAFMKAMGMEDHLRFKCSWCSKAATHFGEDGTYSCGYGQGERGKPHNNKNVTYTPL